MIELELLERPAVNNWQFSAVRLCPVPSGLVPQKTATVHEYVSGTCTGLYHINILYCTWYQKPIIRHC